jgi:phosphoribosylglycinamide formyltransferase 1
MKAVIFTSNAIRHKYFANIIATECELLVVSECKELNGQVGREDFSEAMKKHFAERTSTEKEMFKGNDVFRAPTLPILYREVNLQYIYDVAEAWKPDALFCFGASIIQDSLINLPTTTGYFINLHLGLSPYYKGSGTNFWPFVNDELDCVGSTIHHIDPGIDTGDLIAHIRPSFEMGDNVHVMGNKVIGASAAAFIRIIEKIRNGEKIPRVPQWKANSERIYKMKDFDDRALEKYHANLAGGMVERYLRGPSSDIQLISLE